jgi:uncharacterized protein (DUF2141 family)
MKFIFAFVIFLTSFAISADAATVKVKINGVKQNAGNIVVGLFSDKAASSFPGGKPLASKSIPAKENTVNVVFDGVEPGVYAIGVFNDINKNNNLDKGPFGIPKEQYGNSGEKTSRQPVFTKSKFEVGNEGKQIELQVH